MKQHPSLGVRASCMHTMVPSDFGLICSRKSGWGYAIGLCKLAREPGRSSHLLSRLRGNINSTHRFLHSWVNPSAPVKFLWFPTFSMWSLSLCLLSSCSVCSELSLRRICSKQMYIQCILVRGLSLVSTCTTSQILILY